MTNPHINCVPEDWVTPACPPLWLAYLRSIERLGNRFSSVHPFLQRGILDEGYPLVITLNLDTALFRIHDPMENSYEGKG